jgi:hypothetical protein
MGVDAKIYLPGNVRLSTVVEVVARLLDAPAVYKKLEPEKPKSTSWHASIPEGVVEYRNTVQGLVGVTIGQINPALRGSEHFPFSYHYEFGGYKGMGACRGMILRSWDCNIAILRGLADFFGGIVDHQDCDDEERDYVVADKPDNMNCPEDGRAWQFLQERIMAVEPLTQEQIDACDQYAAYHENVGERTKRLAMKKKTSASIAVETLAKELGKSVDFVTALLRNGGAM